MVPNHGHGTLLGGSSHLVLVGRALSWFYLIHKSVLTCFNPTYEVGESSKDGDYMSVAAGGSPLPRCKVKHPAKATPNVSVSQAPAAHPAREAGCRCVVMVGSLIR